MSEEIQRRVRERREAAKRRKANARERAERNRERGDGMLARMHEDNAEAEAAEAAERRRLADVEREGERIGEPVRDTRDA
ncbi:MAG TPA: hypothetical protein VFZ00_03060 [Solirubrobacter sp.]|nr:hypothetical protein [Solirubrobacter sp.]